jgi:hypothetical protein
MSDPILNGTNPAADRRLMDDVMSAPDPFDGGCAHDCADRHDTRGLTEASLSRADRHVIAMCTSSFELGWLRCYRKAEAIVADLPIDPSVKASVLLAIMGLPGKPSTDAAKAHRRDQVEMHLRIASGV